MIAIGMSSISLVLGARPIFTNLNWEIQHGQRIGLIGPNGAGKSSLLGLIAGRLTAEPGGAVSRAKGLTVGYLMQDPDLAPAQSALESALVGDPRIAEVQAELSRVESRLADPAVYNSPRALSRALERQQELLAEFDEIEGASYEARAWQALCGLGLTPADFATTVGSLSGGQKKSVGLVRLMLSRASVLLLDEPDNHLDLAGKASLERMLAAYPGAVVIVSHDRYLLDAVVSHIAELEDGRLTMAAGDYSTYAVDKERRLARHDELYRVQQREIRRLEVVVKRYALWGRQYDNEDFARRAKTVQRRIDRIERIERPVLERKQMRVDLGGWRGSTRVLELAAVTKAFDGRVVLDDVNMLIRHGERVGLVGPNGAGKSLILRLVLGEAQPDSGIVKIGPSIRVGYYAQEHETLDYSQTPIEALRNAARLTEGAAVSFLSRYLFTYQQVSQSIGELSGGERSRLQLALLAAPGKAGPNLLLLDEPTNNLDIASAEVLEEALEEFAGTLLVVSHDRYFLDRTVGRTVMVRDGRLAEFQGGYSDMLAAGAS